MQLQLLLPQTSYYMKNDFKLLENKLKLLQYNIKIFIIFYVTVIKVRNIRNWF